VKGKPKRDPERAAEAASRFADVAAPQTVDSGPPAVAIEDGLPTTRRARALRRGAANRSRRSLGKPTWPDIVPGRCEPCGGWGILGSAGVRCQLCLGTGDS
jgi:hypothetical protein